MIGRFLKLYVRVLLSFLAGTLFVALAVGLKYGFSIFLKADIRDLYVFLVLWVFAVALVTAVENSFNGSDRGGVTSQTTRNGRRTFVFGVWLIIGSLVCILTLLFGGLHFSFGMPVYDGDGAVVSDPVLAREVPLTACAFALGAILGALGLRRTRLIAETKTAA